MYVLAPSSKYVDISWKITYQHKLLDFVDQGVASLDLGI